LWTVENNYLRMHIVPIYFILSYHSFLASSIIHTFLFLTQLCLTLNFSTYFGLKMCNLYNSAQWSKNNLEFEYDPIRSWKVIRIRRLKIPRIWYANQCLNQRYFLFWGNCVNQFILRFDYRISRNSFRPWIVSTLACKVEFKKE
jgi:hypothetical protein